MKSEVRTLNIKIRKEEYDDYKSIAKINVLAFSSDRYIGEVALIDSLRHCVSFDRELSLVAEVDGKVVGYVLFFPFDTVIANKILRAVCLAPIAVHPEYQKYGVGSHLINEGHKIAKEKGVKFSFLYGHRSYYPRFGYELGMFGDSTIKIERPNVITGLPNIEEREIRLEDIDTLLDMFEMWFGNIDLTLKPTNSILDWISHTAPIKTSVIIIDGKVDGYLRYNADDLTDIRMFLAKDKKSTEFMINYLANKFGTSDTITLPMHPDSVAISMFDSFNYKIDLQRWSAGMIKILDEECKEIIEYCDQVASEKRKPGKIIFPPSYDMA
jgi:predicted N-acetyltransferase YhbS